MKPVLRFIKLSVASLTLAACIAVPLHADMAGAKAAYMAGRAKMAAKDYSGAVADFTASIEAESKYIFALRERGTCKYYLKDKAGALEDYRAYSVANPKDAKTAALVKKLEADPEAQKKKEGGFRWWHIFVPWKWF